MHFALFCAHFIYFTFNIYISTFGYCVFICTSIHKNLLENQKTKNNKNNVTIKALMAPGRWGSPLVTSNVIVP